MLIDEFLPEYDFAERHAIVVRAPVESVLEAARDWRPADSFLWRLLLRLRGLGSPAGTLREWAEANGFVQLGDSGDEVLYGQMGRFWALNERAAMLSPRSVDDFRRFNEPGYAVALMNVRTEPLDGERTLVSTETRVRCLGPAARRWFRLYWLLIRPFSGLLRRAMLQGMRARATAAQSLPLETKRET